MIRNSSLGNGIRLSTPITRLDGLLVTSVTANNNGSSSKPNRGILLQGNQRNVTIDNSSFSNNLLVDIDFNSGIRSGTLIRNSTVIGNIDPGIALIGVVKSFASPMGGRITRAANNTVTDNSRFGIEMKNPSGNGLGSGTGSVVVRGSRVNRITPATELRDYAGISGFRRSVAVSSHGAHEPAGVWLENNFIAKYLRNPVAAGPVQAWIVNAQSMPIANVTLGQLSTDTLLVAS